MKKYLVIFFLLTISGVYAQTCDRDYCLDHFSDVACDFTTNFADEPSKTFYYSSDHGNDWIRLIEGFTRFSDLEVGDKIEFDGSIFELLSLSTSPPGYLQVKINSEVYNIPQDNVVHGYLEAKQKFGGYDIYYGAGDVLFLFLRPKQPQELRLDKHETSTFLGKTVTFADFYREGLGWSLSDCLTATILYGNGCIDYCTPTPNNGVCELSEEEPMNSWGHYDYSPTDCGSDKCGDGLCEYVDYSSCRQDCVGELCGDNWCEEFEYDSCKEDCGNCGDGVCWYYRSEDTHCPADCGSKSVKPGRLELYPNVKVPIDNSYSVSFKGMTGGVIKDNSRINQSALIDFYKGNTLVKSFEIAPNSYVSFNDFLPDQGVAVMDTYDTGYFSPVYYVIKPFKKNSTGLSGYAYRTGDFLLVAYPEVRQYEKERKFNGYYLVLYDVNTKNKVAYNGLPEYVSVPKIIKLGDKLNITLEYKEHNSENMRLSPVEICGDNICSSSEKPETCCRDCGCNDGFKCKEDKCIEIGCQNDDGICPKKCSFIEDNDCDECTSDSSCKDDLACTTDACIGTPKRCSHETMSGCELNGQCVSYGTMNEKKYCDSDNSFKEIKTTKDECTENYECTSGICSDGKCKNKNYFLFVIDWLREFFS